MIGRLRVGVVGVGRLGFHHARLVAARGDAVLAGVVDADDCRARHVAGELGTRAFESLEALLDRCDAAIIASPATAHGSLALTALERGVHVLVEKPLAASVSEAEALVAAAAWARAVLHVGHCERFNPQFRALAARCRAARRFAAVRLSPRLGAADVSAALDLLVHDIDLACALLGGRVEEVRARESSRPERVRTRLTFSTGQVVELVAARGARRAVRRWRAYDSAGAHDADLLAGAGGGLLPAVHEAFVSAIRRRSDGGVGGRAGLEAVRIAHRVMEAARRARDGALAA